jgi:hypothetical protein
VTAGLRCAPERLPNGERIRARAVIPIATPMSVRRKKDSGRAATTGEPGCSRRMVKALAEIMKSARRHASQRYSGQWDRMTRSMVRHLSTPAGKAYKAREVACFARMGRITSGQREPRASTRHLLTGNQAELVAPPGLLLQRALHAGLRVLIQFWTRKFVDMLREQLTRLADQVQLLRVTRAPLAKATMQAEPKARGCRQLVITGFRSQSRHFTAGRRQRPEPVGNLGPEPRTWGTIFGQVRHVGDKSRTNAKPYTDFIVDRSNFEWVQTPHGYDFGFTAILSLVRASGERLPFISAAPFSGHDRNAFPMKPS